MRRGSRFCITFLTALLMQGGCVDTPKASQEAVSPDQLQTERVGRVSSNWQIRFQKHFAASDASEAYGFFSESSYADAGQYLILVENNQASLIKTSPAGKTLSDETPMSVEVWSTLNAVLDASANLDDLAVTQFDGIHYEFVHWRKTGAAVRAHKRIYIAKPNFTSADKSHADLVKAFTDLQSADR